MAEFHKVAENLLTKFGFEISAFNLISSVFDIEAGKEIESVSTITNGVAVIIQLDTGKLKENGYLFKENDIKILLSVPLDFDFNISSVLSIKGVNYKVSFLEEVKDVLDTALYKVVLRLNAE